MIHVWYNTIFLYSLSSSCPALCMLCLFPCPDCQLCPPWLLPLGQIASCSSPVASPFNLSVCSVLLPVFFVFTHRNTLAWTCYLPVFSFCLPACLPDLHRTCFGPWLLLSPAGLVSPNVAPSSNVSYFFLWERFMFNKNIYVNGVMERSVYGFLFIEPGGGYGCFRLLKDCCYQGERACGLCFRLQPDCP